MWSQIRSDSPGYLVVSHPIVAAGVEGHALGQQWERTQFGFDCIQVPFYSNRRRGDPDAAAAPARSDSQAPALVASPPWLWGLWKSCPCHPNSWELPITHSQRPPRLQNENSDWSNPIFNPISLLSLECSSYQCELWIQMRTELFGGRHNGHRNLCWSVGWKSHLPARAVRW